MSTGRRAYDLMRGFVNQEWERIRGVDETEAQRELRESLERQALSPEPPAQVQRTVEPVNPPEWARKILGVSSTADFTEIRQAFERLNTRSDPSKFPVGSAESRQAADIQRRIQQAYAILTDGIDSTEKRFKSLEID